MINCPYCGSSAQPSRIGKPYPNEYNYNEMFEYYVCGCGCHFRAVYDRDTEELKEVVELILPDIEEEEEM